MAAYNPALSDAALTRDQAGHLTDAAIDTVRSAIAGYVAYLDAWGPCWPLSDVAEARQQATADRARAEILYPQAAAVVKAWADSQERPDLASWAFTVGALRDMADAYSDCVAGMADPFYPHRRYL